MSTQPCVALCFFGLVKDYTQVAASVEKYVLTSLRRQGYRYEVYIHTYKQKLTSNPRNGERAVVIKHTSILPYFPHATVRREHPKVADKVHPLEYYLQRGDPWRDNPRISMLNYSRQLYSLRRVTGLWAPHAAKYQYVIYLRPDVLFTSPFTILPLTQQQVAVPNFHSFGGCNDRFAYGSPSAMKMYGSRLDWTDSYFATNTGSLHAEGYLKKFLQAHALEVVRIPIHFIRLRANGKMNSSDVAVRKKALA